MSQSKHKTRKSCGVLIQHKETYLIGRVTHQPKQYGIPKGGQEAGESDRDTALRELYEETNIQLKLSDIPEEPFIKYTSKGGKKMVVFRVILDELPENVFCRTMVTGKDYPEFDEFKWVVKSEALELIKNHMHKIFEELK